MFVNFFYKLREVGIPVTPTSFLRLQKALCLGLITSLEDFYTSARAILVKSERYFDLYDQVFAHYFKGMDLPDQEGIDLDEAARMLLEEWLRNPEEVAQAMGVDPEELLKLSPQFKTPNILTYRLVGPVVRQHLSHLSSDGIGDSDDHIRVNGYAM